MRTFPKGLCLMRDWMAGLSMPVSRKVIQEYSVLWSHHERYFRQTNGQTSVLRSEGAQQQPRAGERPPSSVSRGHCPDTAVSAVSCHGGSKPCLWKPAPPEGLDGELLGDPNPPSNWGRPQWLQERREDSSNDDKNIIIITTMTTL